MHFWKSQKSCQDFCYLDLKDKVCEGRVSVIKKGELFLALHRSENESAFPGLWDFPGGRMEEGEEFIESLTREVAEETTLKIKPRETPIGIYYAESRPGVLVEFSVYAIDEFSGEVKICKEHSEYKCQVSTIL